MVLGSEVEVKLYQPVNGSKTFVGELLAYDDGAVLIRSGKREDRFEKNQIAKVKLYVSF